MLNLTADVLRILDILYYGSAVLLLYIGSLMLVLYLKYFRQVEESSPEPSPHTPFVSVVVPLYNDEKNIAFTLSSILDSNYPKDKLEVIVVDDASTDNSYEVAKKFEEFGVKVIKLEKNSGAAHAKNVGIKAARGEIVITIDSDSIMDKNAIRNFIPYFEDPSVAGVSGAIRTQKPKNLMQKFQQYEYDIILFVRKILEILDSIPVTPGGMSAFRRGYVLEVGGFDEKSLTEDQEIAFKLQKHNYRVKCSLESFSYTEVPDTFGGFLKQRVRWIRGGVYNRIIHRAIFNLNYGDFLFLGFIFDFIYAIPVALLIISSFTKILLLKPYFLVFKISIIETFLISLNFLALLSIVLIVLYFYWSIYMLNVVRRKAGDKELSLDELPSLLLYAFVYSSFWMIAWIIVFYKEFVGEGYQWGTR